jgi:peptidoglycan/LPS O-acetylase OafA/YrhL
MHLLARDYYLRGALSFFFYFYFGYVCRGPILAAARFPAVPAAVLAITGYGVLAWIASRVAGVVPGAAIRLLAVAVGVIGAIYLGKALAIRSDARRFFGRLGQMTLPIYLTHLLFMMPLVYWLARLHSPALRETGVWLAIAVSGIAIVGSVAITALALALRLNFFFFPPKLRLFARIAALFGRDDIYAARAETPDETRPAEARS